MVQVTVAESGTFTALQLAVQVPLLMAQVRQGRIRVAQKGASRYLWFTDGQVRAVTSALEEERLGNWLVERGILPRVEIRDALALKTREQRLGAYLISQHLIEPNRLREELEALTFALAGRMLFEAGEYAGEPAEAVPDDATTTLYPPGKLFFVAARKVPDTGQFDRLLAGKRTWIAKPNNSGSDVELTPLEKFVLGLLSTPKSLDDLRTAAPDYPKEVARALACMVAAGMVLDSRGIPTASTLPAANPRLRAFLSQLEPRSSGAGEPVEATMAPTEEDIRQAIADKQTAFNLLGSGGDERTVVKLLASAVQIIPDSDTLTTLAEIELGNPLWRQRALERLKKAVELNPRCTKAWLALGNYWGLRGMADKQRRCLERILSFEPLNEAVRESLRSLTPPSPS
jgi:tetratricopeptide (TPR) repeat protein